MISFFSIFSDKRKFWIFLAIFICFSLILWNLNTKEKFRRRFSSNSSALVVYLQPNSRYPCVVIKIYDGDTFRCKLNDGQEIRVRLIGVDAPESTRNAKAYRDARRTGIDIEEIIEMGKEAKAFVERILKRGTKVILETDVQITDKYGRVLAYVYLPNGKMLNLLLVEEGFAKLYTIPPNVKYEEVFRKAQRIAIEEGKGLWSEGLR